VAGRSAAFWAEICSQKENLKKIMEKVELPRFPLV
jgi:hypothetical protein